MEPRKNEKREPTRVHRQEQKSKLRIVKLEPRIAPGVNLGNHNETLVRDTAKPNPKADETKRRVRLQIVRLEERIAPGIRLQNHNETLVRDRAGNDR